MRLVLALLACLAALPAAAEVSFDGAAAQGGLVRGRVPPGSVVTYNGRALRVSPDGDFIIGFGRDAGPRATVDVAAPGSARETTTLTIAPRRFDIQRIDGLPEAQVSPTPQDVARIRDENALVAAARTRDLADAFFRGGFMWPVTGRISGVYGSQRILNGQPRAPHWGVDVAAPTGTPVVATADAVVTLVHQGMLLTGKTMLLDHGHGLSSVYFHLSEVAVREGQRVRRGEVVGKVGATGRATGPHLHWGMNWFDVRIDPALLVPPMPAGPEKNQGG